MEMHVHEIHPAVIHAPLVLIPAAAAIDWLAAGSGNETTARIGRNFWIAATVSGAVSGLSGLAASQEIKAKDKIAQDMVFLHGLVNFVLVGSTLAITTWRLRNEPTYAQAALGLVASGALGYSAYLGGAMVYRHGIGVHAMPESASQGVISSPSVFSGEALGVFFRDAARGITWLAQQAGQVFRGRRHIEREAVAGVEARREELGRREPLREEQIYTPPAP